jgi:hypothetical protein
MKYAYILAYIAVVVAANFTAMTFIPLPLFGLVAVGTLFFGATFTLRDRVHRYGRRTTYTMIAAAAVIGVIQSLFIAVPWRIIAASFTAILINEAADTEIYEALKQRHPLVRIFGSNAVSIPLDTILFTLLAFAGEPAFPMSVLIAIIYGDILAKFAVASLIAPFIAGNTYARHLLRYE